MIDQTQSMQKILAVAKLEERRAILDELRKLQQAKRVDALTLECAIRIVTDRGLY